MLVSKIDILIGTIIVRRCSNRTNLIEIFISGNYSNCFPHLECMFFANKLLFPPPKLHIFAGKRYRHLLQICRKIQGGVQPLCWVHHLVCLWQQWDWKTFLKTNNLKQIWTSWDGALSFPCLKKETSGSPLIIPHTCQRLLFQIFKLDQCALPTFALCL